MADNPDDEGKGYKGGKLTRLEKRGQIKSDMSQWRVKLQASKVQFDDLKKGIYLRQLSLNGRKMQAARAAGVSRSTVLIHADKDPLFAEAEQEALSDYADRVHTLAFTLMSGVKKPIVGGKDKDEIITHELVHAVPLVAMELRKTDPAYREKIDDPNAAKLGGVLVVPAGETPEDFLKRMERENANKKEPGAETK